MRRLAAISALFALLSLWSAPLLAAMSAGSQRNLPLCCRRSGKHHCMGTSTEQPVTSTVIIAPRENCPCSPKSLIPGSARMDLFAPSAHGIFYAEIQTHPAVFAQTEAYYRVASDRSRLKRGPPA